MTADVKEERMLVLAAYVLHLVGAIAAVPSLIGLILNYLKRGAGDPDLSSHHQWMIETFWWAMLWFVIGAILTIVLVGWLIVAIAWVWYLYRHVRGLLRLIEGRPAPFSG